jgi:hypothetical protein
MRTDYAVYFTPKSSNRKIGPVPVSTITAETCWDGCAFRLAGCYAKGGPVSMIWDALTNHSPGAVWHNAQGARYQSLTWNRYCYEIAALPLGQPWRHGQAGDLPGTNEQIDARALRRLVRANRGKRGWTYTHKPMLACETVTEQQAAANRQAVSHANANGFTINLSANALSEVDRLLALDIGPVAVVLPSTVHGRTDIFTPNGTRIVVCPATYQEKTRCVDCMLCQRQRTCVVGFPAHGNAKRKASNVASRVVITRNAA